MCGIAGYVLKEGLTRDGGDILSMSRALRHRGPDDEGYTLIDTRLSKHIDLAGRDSHPAIRGALMEMGAAPVPVAHNLALTHRRYSIVDLSHAGHQPMWDADRRTCVTFNGEIYNYRELREILSACGHRFVTATDTEVLLAGYREWGTALFDRLIGPWALALYDACTRRVLLSRDRIGKAPLYLMRTHHRFSWASEIKALLGTSGPAHPSPRGQAVHDFVLHDRRDLDGTFWESVEDFPPGSYAWLGQDLQLEPRRYWRVPSERLRDGEVSPDEAGQRLTGLLTDAIRIRLRADVPVAFELSGGMDSSSLVALAASGLSERLTVYNVAFPEAHANEEPYARQVYERYRNRVDYRVIRPGPTDFWNEADAFVHLEEEPFHSPNLQTNQALRSIIKAGGAGVVITGAAGDEVLAGYAGAYFVPFARGLLRAGRLSTLLHELHSNTELNPFTALGVLLLKLGAGPRFADSVRRWHRGEPGLLRGIYRAPPAARARYLPDSTFEECYEAYLTKWKMNYWLRSSDKLNFGIPIEPRAPFLDHRVIEVAASLPASLLIRNGWHKWILRRAMQDLLPDEVVWRANKMGFPFPHREWLLRSETIVRRNVSGLDCPYVNTGTLMNRYAHLAERAPILLWRLVSLLLWWRRMVEGKNVMGTQV